MRALRSLFSILIFLSVILASFQSASARATTTTYSVKLKNATIPWFSPPPEGLSSFCNEVPEGVHINPDDFGTDRVKDATVTELTGGKIRITVNDRIRGTASDNSGQAYTFSYGNFATYEYDGVVVTVRMKDIFTVTGADVNYTVGFNWEWQYVSTTGLDVVPIVENGQTVNLEVVPFTFPTDDGVTETMNPDYIPGSWLKHSTRGDVWSCDML